MKPLDVRFKDCVRDLIRETTWFRLRSVEETIEVSAYRRPRAEFDLAGARSVMEAKFPDLNAVEVKTREDIGGFGFELASRPFRGELLVFKAGALGEVAGVAKAPASRDAVAAVGTERRSGIRRWRRRWTSTEWRSTPSTPWCEIPCPSITWTLR